MKALFIAVLFCLFVRDADATVITSGVDLRWTATNAAGEQVLWGRSGGSAVQIVNGQQIFIPRPAGFTLHGGFSRPSERGTYISSLDMCSTLLCSTIYSADGSAVVLSDASSDFIVDQIFEDGTFVGHVGNVASIRVGHVGDPTQTTALGAFPAGFSGSVYQATRVGGSIIGAGALYGNNDNSSYALVQSDVDSIQLNANTLGSVAFGISSTATFAAGGDGAKAVVWDIATRQQILASTTLDGYYFTVLNSSAAAGEDQQGHGIIYSPYFDTVMDTCSFIEASGGTVPAGYRNAQGVCTLGRTHLSEYLDPVTNHLTVNIAAAGSAIDFSPPDPIYFNAPGWTQAASAVPEPRTAIVVACGLLGLIFASRKRSAQQ